MTNLLTQCNADVYKAILDIKDNISVVLGEDLITILQSHTSPFDVTCTDMLWFSAHLPYGLWDYKVHTFYLLFKSQQITKMP